MCRCICSSVSRCRASSPASPARSMRCSTISSAPRRWQLAQSVEGLLMVIVGGVGTLFGAFIGSAAIIALENVVSSYTERWPMVLGITFVLIMIFAPEGIIGKLRAILSRKVQPQSKCFHERTVDMDRRQFLKTTTATVAAAGVGAHPGAPPSPRRARSRSACWRRSPASSPPAARKSSRACSIYLDQVKSEIGGRQVETGYRGRRFEPRHRAAEGAPPGRAGQLPTC